MNPEAAAARAVERPGPSGRRWSSGGTRRSRQPSGKSWPVRGGRAVRGDARDEVIRGSLLIVEIRRHSTARRRHELIQRPPCRCQVKRRNPDDSPDPAFLGCSKDRPRTRRSPPFTPPSPSTRGWGRRTSKSPRRFRSTPPEGLPPRLLRGRARTRGRRGPMTTLDSFRSRSILPPPA